ncbi:hypothetical protein TBLA_0D02430 [Henningerozyma blattae CBS 6284]|uniref:Uncharacterized protein n=1 Tax=Henningerozyma blattae (strain ATCC 34711 / CBS 6284 / DSM 70876 / NBRC 10599 / NRRL Y-10934 / UCD 77-7) TaxID=1071380 RepID=I2H2Z5_HENB6|nr:hypothetical protein TBLA_0D02430 [Tetrapisispora blattae CBS 6284]CCH60747.1 hypothetical protein TBLA_0D02430 [Tetrapisispora blattae CBS 6284]
MAKNKTSNKQLPVHNPATLPPQEILDLFKVTFNEELYVEDIEKLQADIQDVKSSLFNREYIEAFDDDIKRTAYCIRWSSSRAMAYASLFAFFDPIKKIIQCHSSEDQAVLCIGGGAGGELIALCSMFVYSQNMTKKFSTNNEDVAESPKLKLNLMDIADWSSIIERLENQINEKWLYGGGNDTLNINFIHDDILKMNFNENNVSLSNINLITLLFTTNELFTEHKTESIRLLQKFNKDCKSGCHLLIVESAGSYSHITVGRKQFPIHFLIDTILVGVRTGDKSPSAWSLVSENDSLWYRCDPNCDYPLKVENMRFFIVYIKKIK